LPRKQTQKTLKVKVDAQDQAKATRAARQLRRVGAIGPRVGESPKSTGELVRTRQCDTHRASMASNGHHVHHPR
jgi:hypothetical protein